MGYIRYPIETNPFVLLEQSYNYIKERSPAWEEHDTNLDTWILQILATQGAELREIAQDVPDAIFRYFGNTILAVPPYPAQAAQVNSTWTAIDIVGHLIPSNTMVAIRDNSGTPKGFRTVQDITILPGLNSTEVGEVTLVAVDAGLGSEAIGGADTEAQLIDPLDFVDSVILTDLTSGGADAETVTAYTDRLAEYMRGLSTRPILPEDYASKARNYPGIYRAIALDGYDPATDSYFNDKMIAIAALDQFGLDPPDQVLDDLDTELQSQREVNFIVNILKASRTTIDVNFEAVAVPGYSTGSLEAQAVADLTNYLSPRNWGFDQSVTGSGADRTWVETQFVYYNDLIAVVSNVQGIDHVKTLTSNRSSGAPGTSDIALDLPAALTEPGNIDGMVSSF